MITARVGAVTKRCSCYGTTILFNVLYLQVFMSLARPVLGPEADRHGRTHSTRSCNDLPPAPHLQGEPTNDAATSRCYDALRLLRGGSVRAPLGLTLES